MNRPWKAKAGPAQGITCQGWSRGQATDQALGSGHPRAWGGQGLGVPANAQLCRWRQAADSCTPSRRFAEKHEAAHFRARLD